MYISVRKYLYINNHCIYLLIYYIYIIIHVRLHTSIRVVIAYKVDMYMSIHIHK